MKAGCQDLFHKNSGTILQKRSRTMGKTHRHDTMKICNFLIIARITRTD